jgi:hypothetical protein
MNKFTKTEKIIISSFGLISAIVGIYAVWLDNVGLYEEMGLLFVIWLPLQVPVYIITPLIASLFGVSVSIIYLITFIWWFLLGSFLGFIIALFGNYFSSIYVK